MLIKATVLYPVEVKFRTKEKDPTKIKERIIEESEKIFNRQFSEPYILSANVDICTPNEEIVIIPPPKTKRARIK